MTRLAHIVYPFAPEESVGYHILYQGPEGLLTVGREPIDGIVNVQTGEWEEPLKVRNGVGDWTGEYVQYAIALEPSIVQPHCYCDEWTDRFRVVFSFNGDARNVVHFRHRLPMLWPALPEEMDVRPWDERKSAIIAVCANKYWHRYEGLLHLAALAREVGLGFDVYGNVPFAEPWYRGRLPFGEKIATMAQYRYAFCPENHPTTLYVSEKLPEAIAAGCVPIYFDRHMGYPLFREYPLIPWKLVAGSDAPFSSPGLMQELHDWGRTDAYRRMCEDMSFGHIARLILNTVGAEP